MYDFCKLETTDSPVTLINSDFLFSLNICYVGSAVRVSLERRTVTDGNQSLKLLTGFQSTSLGSFRGEIISIIDQS